jgi:hypothetical protein
LKTSGACSTTSKRPRTSASVAWLMRSMPGGALCSMRAAS